MFSAREAATLSITNPQETGEIAKPCIKHEAVKKVIVFSVPSRDVTNQTIPGRELLNYSRPG
jgi:hypothetical protein